MDVAQQRLYKAADPNVGKAAVNLRKQMRSGWLARAAFFILVFSLQSSVEGRRHKPFGVLTPLENH